MRWPQAAIDYALSTFPEHFRRAVVLGLYTGQREGDCIRMRWDDWDGESICVVQGKTGAKLRVPCHRTLTAELSAWKADASATTILVNARGLPWSHGPSFCNQFSRLIRKHSTLDGLVFHGLRKEAASRLAEAGCSVHEIMSVTGHASIQMVEHYSKQADQVGRAKAAILKLERRK